MNIKKDLKLKTINLSLILAMLVVLLPINTIGANPAQEIKDIRITERSNGATIRWNTAEVTETQIRYGLNTEYGTLVKSDYLKKSHLVTLHSLDAGTNYFYEIIAGEGSGKVTSEGSFKTTGTKPQLTVYQNYFTLLFDDYWRNINGFNPELISDIDGLDFNQTGFTGKALKVSRPDSFLQYSCDKIYNSRAGAVTAWVSFNDFNKSSVIWQTNDSRYALYFEVGGTGAGFDKRIVARAGGNIDGEYPEAEYIIDPEGGARNIWGRNEWHFVAMTWYGMPNGTVKLYIDGKKVDQASYSDGGGCASFRIGNNYRDDNMHFSNGKIDELKIHQWEMSSYYVNQNYLAYSYSPNFEKKGEYGTVAGAVVRKFNHGKLIKAPDGKIYVISRGAKIHISDIYALSRFKSHPIISATWDEVSQYADGGKFYSWSRYPDGTLLKGSGKTVYWLWDSEKRPIASEDVFNRYDNDWRDVITITDGELDSYPTGFTYY